MSTFSIFLIGIGVGIIAAFWGGALFLIGLFLGSAAEKRDHVKPSNQ